MINELVKVFSGTRWLMDPKALRVMLQRALTMSAQDVSAAQRQMAAASDRLMQPTLVGDVAVITMAGPIVYRCSWLSMLFGCASIEMMQQQFRSALADPAVRMIVFRCDSPGGNVEMVPEFAEELFAARGTKPVVAVADTVLCSAAYWLASQCDTIYASRSSMLGCIGSYIEHEDISGMLEQLGVKITLIAHPAKKVDGHPYVPLSDTARANLQAYADEVGADFEAAVARGRGVPKARVVEWSELGAPVPPRGKQAIALGLADKTATFDGLMAKLTKKSGVARPSMTTAASGPEMHAAAMAAQRVDMVDPDEDGQCPDGYEKGDDGLCHLMPEEDAKASADSTSRGSLEAQHAEQAAADRDAIGIVLAAGE